MAKTVPDSTILTIGGPETPTGDICIRCYAPLSGMDRAMLFIRAAVYELVELAKGSEDRRVQPAAAMPSVLE